MRTGREVMSIHHVDVDGSKVEWCPWGCEAVARITRVVVKLARGNTGQQKFNVLPAVSIHRLVLCGRRDGRWRVRVLVAGRADLEKSRLSVP